MLSIKFNLAVSFSLLKIVESLLYRLASSFDSLAVFLVSLLCLRLFIFLLLVREIFFIPLNVKGSFCFATAFDCS